MEGKDQTTGGVSRREALKGIGAAGAAAAASGPIILIANPAAEASVMGAGSHRYELVKEWGRLPDGIAYGYTHGVGEDKQGRIYIHNQSKDSVVVFDGDGKFIKSWGPEFAGGAHGFQISDEGGTEYIYMADVGRRIVVKTTLDGEVVYTITCPKESGVYPDPNKFVPTNVAIAPDGRVYVADGYGSSYVHIYNAKGEYQKTFGGPGKEDGKLACPHGIWIDTRGAEPLVLVADRSNVRLQFFTLDGEFKSKVTEELRHPCHFHERKGDLLIPDLHGRVTIFDKDNKLITHLGDNPDVQKTKGYPNLPHDQRVPGRFISPHGATWDHDGNIYVVEWINDGRVTKLRRVS